MEVKTQGIFKVEIRTISKRIYDQLEHSKSAKPEELVGQVNVPVSAGTMPMFLAKIGGRFYRVRPQDMFDSLSAARVAKDPTGTWKYSDIVDDIDELSKKLPQIFTV